MGMRKIRHRYQWSDTNNDTNLAKESLYRRGRASCSSITSTVGRIPPALLQTPPPPTSHENPSCLLSPLLSLMLSSVVVDDPAVLRTAEEDVLRLELAELGAEPVVSDAGALVVGQHGGARPHREVAGGAA